jgi:hypothetical protein
MGEVPEQLKPFVFKKGKPGGPGRPPGKSMKDYARDYLSKMTEEERIDFMNSLPKELVWRMAEGNPTEKITGELKTRKITDEQARRIFQREAKRLGIISEQNSEGTSN